MPTIAGSRGWRIPLAALGAAILMLVSWPALAADLRGGDLLTIGADEVIRDDLYVAVQTVIVDGTIEGDLFAAAGTVIVNGRVTGSVFAAAYEVSIAGRVEGDVRAAARIVNVSSSVGGDLLAAGDQIDIVSSGRIGRDALLVGRTVTLDGPLSRNLRGGGDTVHLNAPIGGNVDLFGVEQLTLGPGARIASDVHFQSKQEARREPGAQVQGQIVRREPREERGPDPLERLPRALYSVFALTIVGAGALAIATQATLAAGAAAVQRPLLSLAWGFGLLVGIPIAALLLLITIVGIPLALITLLIYVIVLYAGQAIVCLGVGRFLLGRLRPVDGIGWSLMSLLVGTLLLAAFRLVPYLDGIVSFGVFMVGLGAIWLTYLDRRLPQPAPG